MKKFSLNETVDVGPNTAGEIGNVFFVGTDSSAAEINSDWSLKEFKKKHKNLDQLSVENGFFVTSLPQYAIQYAENFATENDSRPIVLAVEFKKDMKFFDLEDPDDYAAIGIDGDISEIFISAEPYFAINTVVPNQKMPYQPYEFSIIKKMLDQSGQWVKNIESKRVFNKIETMLSSETEFVDAYEKTYMTEMRGAFENLLGKGNPVISQKYEVNPYPDRARFIADVRADQAQAIADGRVKPGSDKVHVRSKDKESESGAAHGMWTAGMTTEDGLPRYNKARPILYYPDSVKDLPLFRNYMLLFGRNTDKTKQKEFEPFNKHYNKKLYDAYLKLFAEMHRFMDEPEQKNELGKTRLGINNIKDRLKSKMKGGGKSADGKHIYIDYIQFICFSMILDRCMKKNIDVYGMATRERIGYSAIRDGKPGYMYLQDELNDGFIQQKDRTLIICRPLEMGRDVMVVGHDVSQLKAYDPDGIIVRNAFDSAGRVQGIDQYKAIIFGICDEIDRKRDEAFNRSKQLYVSGTAYKVIDGELNTCFPINLSGCRFDGYVGDDNIASVENWLASIAEHAGYGLTVIKFNVIEKDVQYSRKNCNIRVNLNVGRDVDSRRRTEFDEDPAACIGALKKAQPYAAEKCRKRTYSEKTQADSGSGSGIEAGKGTAAAKPDVQGGDSENRSVSRSRDAQDEVPRSKYSAYTAEIMVDVGDGNSYRFDFALKDTINPDAYVKNIILSGMAKDVPSYLFQKAAFAELQKQRGFSGEKRQIAPFIRDPRIECENPYVILDIRPAGIQPPDISGNVMFAPVSKDYDSAVASIQKDIAEILMPDGLVDAVQAWLDAHKLNYRLKERKSWMNVAKQMFGCTFTQKEIDKLDESYAEISFLEYLRI